MNKILLVDNDQNFGLLLSEYLSDSGYEVDYTSDSSVSIEKLSETTYNLVLTEVDLMPISGLDLLRDIRLMYRETAVIFLSHLSRKEDILAGYKAGCDEYITKPCPMDILLAKIAAVLSRYMPREELPEQFEYKGVRLDATKQNLSINGKETHLTTHQNELLCLLWQNKNHLVARDVVLKKIWRGDSYFQSRSLNVFINQLRQLLGDTDIRIVSVRGRGYRLVED